MPTPNKYGRPTNRKQNSRGGVDVNALMQQAQQMQAQMAEAQEKLKDLEVSASAGGGMVKVTATCDMRLTSVTIDPAAVDPDDVELLQDMVIAAVNNAFEQAEDLASKQVSSASGLDALGGMGGLEGALGSMGLGNLGNLF